MQKSNGKINILGLMMVLSIVSQEAITVPVYASTSNITGVSPNGNEFNITPSKVNADTGFRHYNNFRLSKDDVANLIFSKDGKNISKFVNLVDNRIYINGILNTLNANGAFTNGHAVFVSPNGMVVGASGVLNVGSLTAISPNVTSYLKYTGYYMGSDVLNSAAGELGISSSNITIPGISDEINLKLLKETDQKGDIRILGKIFAQDSVELIGKNIYVGSSQTDSNITNDEKPFEEEALDGFKKAGIFAGVPSDKQIKMQTIEQASNLFDALVTNNIENGSGFSKDVNGNIIIKAQSFKEAELSTPDSITVKGITYTIDELFEYVKDDSSTEDDPVYKLAMKSESALNKLGLSLSDVESAYNDILSTQNEVDATDSSAFNEQNAAKVNVNNAVLAGKNVDVNAVSKVSYTAEKGSSLFDRLVNTVAEAAGSTVMDTLLDNLVSSNATFNDFEGSRANASVVIDENSTLYADKNVDVKSLAVAQTAIKLTSLKNPKLDTTSEGFYYLGTKTGSSVIVKETANLIAGEDVDILASSKNSLNVKIKNPTSTADVTAGEIINAPSVQVSFLQAVTQADTNAEVQKGATIKAGKDVNVTASNYTSDQIVLNSVANVIKPSDNSKNSGIAVAVTLKDTEINTSALLDGNVTAGKTDKNGDVISGKNGNVNVNAQNMHVAYTSSNTEVKEAGKTAAKGSLIGKVSKKVTGIIAGKISGIQEGLDSVADVNSNLPSASVALVVNNSDVNSTAKIGKNAKINTGHDVNVNSTIVDMSVNNATGKIELPEEGKTSSEKFSASGSVSVIVNNQKNNSSAIIENGEKDQNGNVINAKIKAGNDINVNATTEQPMNDATFTLGLNFLQTLTDTKDMFSETVKNTNSFDFNSDWDFRTLMEQLKSPADETVYDIKNLMVGIDNAGLSTLGAKGFFNNWSEASAKNAGTLGISASVTVSDILNSTTAKVGHYADLQCNNLIVNAANNVVQFNAAGQISKLWSIAGDNSGGNGIGGTVIVESTDSNAVAEIGDNVVISANGDVDVNSANKQDFLTIALTGSKAGNDNGVSISGTTVVQEVKGKTSALIGSSEINANNLNVVAGKAKISKIPTALEQLNKNPFEDLDSERFEVGLEEDLNIGEIKKFTETDVNIGIDTELGFDESDLTSTSVITGNGLAKLNNAEEINDGISNMMITGALARQAQTGATTSKNGSSGVAVGASVNVSEFAREVNAFINNGATITLAKSLNVLANSKTQSLNIAVAGAFAGGADMKKEPGFIDKTKDKLKHKSEGYLTKAQGVISKITGATDSSEDSPVTTDKLDDKGNPILTYKGVEYKTDLNGQYYDPKTGNVLKDGNGNAVKATDNLNSSSSSSSSSGSGIGGKDSKNTSGKNLSVAIAGSVNTQINNSKVTAKIGDDTLKNAPKTTITAGENVNVNATQKTSSLNVGGGVSMAATVGAGAAVNLIENSNITTAGIYSSDILFTGKDNKLNVLSEENNDNVQVAIGVGISKNDLNDTKLSSAIGGSFNADLLTNSVVSEINNSTVNNIDKDVNTVNVDVNAENHSTSYKGAGAMNMNIASANSMAVGAGMSGNINIVKKTTKSIIDDSEINNAKKVSVASNKDKNEKTENIIDVAIAGSVIAGGKNSYSFTGAMSTNVIENEIAAQISNSLISTNDDVSVIANSWHKNWSSAGSLGFSASPKGAGVGAGVVVNVLDNNIYSGIENSEIKTANTVDVKSYNKDDLNFIAVNMGIQSNGSTVDANGIANVIQSEISSTIKKSTIETNSNINVLSDYNTDIFGVTAVGAVSAGKGVAIGANVLTNTLLTKNIASIENDNELLKNNPTDKTNISDIKAGGKTTVNATSTENIDLIPATVAVTVAGTAAAAANVGVNVVNNTTKAYIDYVNISSNGIDVYATDNTTSRSRGGTLGVAAGGTVGLAGSIITDTYLKDVLSYIDNSTITNGGDIDVSASASNIFGTDKASSITINDIIKDVKNGNYDVSTDTRFDTWDITFDVAGSSTAGVSGSILSKVVANDINSYIGSNTQINTASTIDVLASNATSAAAVIGNVSAGTTAAVGGNIFTNVNTSKVNSGIKSGAKIKKAGNINVNATSTQDYKALTFVVGAAGNGAVNGALNSNLILNETNAYIEKGVEINPIDNKTSVSTLPSGNINVNASDNADVQAFQIEVAAAGSAAVGAIENINVLNNKVNAVVGKTSDKITTTEENSVDTKEGQINTSGKIDIGASSAGNYQANIASVAASSVAAVSSIVVSNTTASEVASGIQDTTVQSDNTVNITASNSFNDKNKNQTSGLNKLLKNNNDIDVDDLSASDKIPLVSVLNIAGSGVAGVPVVIINNNVISETDSYVRNASVKSKNGLNLNATSLMTTYDAIMSGAGSAVASVGTTGVINVYSGTTKADITDSEIDGNVNLKANDTLNLNTVIFSAAGSGTGASVLPVINTNTVSNDVLADIKGTSINNASTINVISDNKINITDGVVAGSINGIGASVNVVPITNVFTGKTRASVDKVSIDGNSVKTAVKASNAIDNTSVILGLSGNGLGASVGGYAMTNVFDNDLSSYINNSSIENAKSTEVNATSTLNMASILSSGGANGIGAGTIVNSLTNVIKNNVESYISASSITGGDINVNALQNAYITSNGFNANFNGIGAGISSNSLVNVFTNNLNAYIDNTETTSAEDVIVSASSSETLNNYNIGFVGSGTTAVNANSIVNVLENNSHAYIDSKSKNISAKSVNVKADDDLTLNNKMGSITGSAGSAIGASINVNVLNNSVKSELLSATDGKITADSVVVDSLTKMYSDSQFISASAGLTGIAGNVIINSIGSKIDTHSASGDELKNANISGTINKANENYNKNVSDITYSKEVTDSNGNTSKKEQNIKNAYSLSGTSTQKRGTVSNVNANVNTNNLTVKAVNEVKGSGKDGALKLTNIVGGVGSTAAGASVLVTDMKYNTSANISGGKIGEVNDETGINYKPNVSVTAKSGINVDIDSIASTAGIKGIAGNVGYTRNSAVTEAIISNTDILADKITLNATSTDNMDVNVIAGSISGLSGNISIAISDTDNTVRTKITDNSNITANNLDIVADNTSTLKSELKSISIGGGTFSTIVNRAKSSAITNALIDATGTVKVAKTLNIIAQSGGINATTTMNLGTISLAGINVSDCGANVSSKFTSGIDNESLTVSTEKTNIKSGVSNKNNSNATTVTAEVKAKNTGLSLANASSTILNANVNSSTNAKSNAKLHESDSVSLISMSDKTAKVTSASASATAVELDILQLNSQVSGSNNIKVGGEHKVKNTFDVKLNDKSKTQTEMSKFKISLVSGSSNKSDSIINSSSTVDFGGKVSADKVEITNTVDKYAYNTLDADSYGLVSVNSYKFDTETKGNSNVNITAKMTDTSYNNSLYVSSTGVNKAESILGSNTVVLGAISQEVSSNTLNAGNYINFNGAEIKSKGNVKVSLYNQNETTMQKSSKTVGIVDFTGGQLENKITANSYIKFFNSSDILAKTIELNVNSDLGNVNDKDTVYNIVKSVDFDAAKATINNTVAQTSEIDIIKSNLTANDKMSINIETSSTYTQGVTAKAKGILAKENAESFLTVTNNNTLSVDKDSTLYADNLKIAQDSSNKLKSYVDIDVHHAGGRDPIGNATLALTVNNKILNSGSIKGGNSVEIDFMKNNSTNNLTQSSKVSVEAAIATGEAKGNLSYNVKNNLEVKKGADITSGKDVIVNYTAGQNTLSSSLHTKKVSRMLFGIPIKKESKSQSITQGVENSLKLNGEIVAGKNARRYMLIDKDGNIVTSQLQGFSNSEYSVSEAGTYSSETLTAEAKATLQAQIDELTEKLTQLSSEDSACTAEIKQYNDTLNSLKNLQNSLNQVSSTITETEAANTIQTNIKQKVVLSSGEDASKNPNKISEDVYNRINSEYSDGDFKTFLENFVVTEEQKDANGNVTQAEVKLTDGQVKNFADTVAGEKSKVTELDYVDATVYDGKIIISSDEALAQLKSDVNSSIDSLTKCKTQLENYQKSIGNQITYYNKQVTENNKKISNLDENPLNGYTISKGTVEFDNLLIQPYKIELNGIQNTDISGTGNFKTFSPNLKVDNYSNNDLIFKTVDLAVSGSSGLYINGTDYSDYMNSQYAVNESVKNTKKTGVHYVSDENIATSDINNIIINNYYDNSNPDAKSAIASDITFNGYVNAPNKFEVFNDSGDIKFYGKIKSDTTSNGLVSVIASQGNIYYNAPGSTLILQADDQILAGQNVDIIAKVITVDGNIKAGYANRSLTITDDMLTNLVVDPTTGKKNMIDLANGNKSAYLNETNNIKALYKNGEIILFNTKQEGGSVKLTGSVDGSGKIYYTNGYANVAIDNKTSAKLVVNSLENNRMNGVATVNNSNVPSTITVENQAAGNVETVSGKKMATTKITSTGFLDIIGAIFNGKNKNNENDGTSKLSVSAQKGVTVNKKTDKTGDTIATIDAVGDVDIVNTASTVNINGVINVANGDLNIINNGTNTTITSIIKNETGDITISNKNGKLNLTNTGSIANKNGNISVVNEGANGTEISGVIESEIGNVELANKAGALIVNNSVTVNNGNITMTNNGEGGASFTENAKVNAAGTASKIQITNTSGGVTIAEGAEISNKSETSEDNVKISNSGKGLLSVLGSIFNKKGNTVVENTNSESGVEIATTGIIKNENGNILLSNEGSEGIDIEGKIQDTTGNITVSNKNSNIVIGEYNSDNDNYISTENGNVIINQINGNILNGIVDGGTVGNNQNHDLGNIDKAYKTLISANGNLSFNIQNGNVGSDTHALTGKKSGFGVNASTRDYTESINVNVTGSVSANASDNELFNLRAKDSNLNIESITTDGNVMITASDWKQADISPAPDSEEYYHGYSVLNASNDNSKANITGKNISIIASDKIGSSSKKLTYNQLDGGSISALSENDLNISGVGAKDTIWQLISKRGNLDFTLDGDAEIREITAGDKLKITSKGQNLTIYDLGKISSITTSDDILYPHDGISFDDGDVTPDKLELKVIGNNSTLNIYNAYVKGSDDTSPDVILRADNIIAHAYEAPSSTVSTKENPKGFNAKEGRTYANDITDENAAKDLKASGFNTVGEGTALIFDVQGVSKADVIAAGGDVNSRDYNLQNPVVSPKKEFENPNAFKETVAKADNVSISLNSGENSPTDNRGLTFDKLYADNAYIDTKDLNLKSIDTFITDYAEFRNGNREATSGGYPISDDYRWVNIVDNDYQRNIANIFNIPVTSQLYTKKTGSFYLNMGDKINQYTKAPSVTYNPNNAVSDYDSENSFFRLTYKDNKIQYVTTTPDFEEIDKSTYLPNKREFIRFAVADDEGFVQVSDKKAIGTPRIISVKDISRGGLLVVHDGSLKLNEKLSVNLTYNDISANVEAEVVRLGSNNQAGLKFINLDKATANKILHMNMSLQANKEIKVKISSN